MSGLEDENSALPFPTTRHLGQMASLETGARMAFRNGGLEDLRAFIEHVVIAYRLRMLIERGVAPDPARADAEALGAKIFAAVWGSGGHDEPA